MDDLGSAFMSSFHRDVLSGIKLSLRTNEGILKLVGKEDSEKEILCQQLKFDLQKDGYDVVYFEDPPKNPAYLTKQICKALKLDKKSNFNRVITAYLIKGANTGKRLTIIFEKAERIEQSVFRTIRMLSNIHDGSKGLVNIVLCGSPILDNVLGLNSMRSLRINQSFEILPTQEYFLEAAIYKDLQVASTNYWPKILVASVALLVLGVVIVIPKELIGDSVDIFTIRPQGDSGDTTDVAMIGRTLRDQAEIITYSPTDDSTVPDVVIEEPVLPIVSTINQSEVAVIGEVSSNARPAEGAEIVVEPEIVTAPAVSIVEVSRPLSRSALSPSESQLEAEVVNSPPIDSGLSNRVTDFAFNESLQYQHLREDILIWIDHWQNQDVEEYFTHYHPDFDAPGFRSIAYWRASRETRILQPEYIEIAIELLEIAQLQNNQATVNLWINFSTPDYEDLTRKELQFRLDGGRWQIYRETNSEVTKLR